ncbi:MAG: ABC transporter ATP-binding protein [Clostridia bacterium]|nr:ABC transporter ATP-binding protein [Clostridia bacterium]
MMLTATQLYHSYGDQVILSGVDLTVQKGELLSIMGESGSGKSTLLSILAGNLRPDRGSVLLDGKEISSMGERELAALRRTSLGFVYQSLNLIPTLNARDNILLPLLLDRKDLSRGKEKMQELADYLRIGHLLTAFPNTMSGGERQRVAIARAMVHDPLVLMLDEPTGSLDSRSTREVMELLRELNQSRGVTVVQVTHSADAAAYGTRTVTLHDGRLIES